MHSIFKQAVLCLVLLIPCQGDAQEPLNAESNTHSQGGTPAMAPIVIQNLRIDTIQNLSIFATSSSNSSRNQFEKASISHERDGVQKKVVMGDDVFSVGDRDNPAVGKGLEIYVFNLGQADSTLVLGPPNARGERKTLLIDMGELSSRSENFRIVASKIRSILHKENPTLDYFVATHFHADHVGAINNGIDGLIRDPEVGIKIKTVVDVGDLAKEYFTESNRSTYDAYNETMGRVVGDRVDVREQPTFGKGQIDLGEGVEVEIVAFAGLVAENDSILKIVNDRYPSQYQNAPPSENDLSIAMEISLGNFEYFTAGDLSGSDDSRGGATLFTPRHGGTYTNVESWMIKRWKADHREGDVEIYRANHHGSAFSSTPDLLNFLDPEFVIYSCSDKYDHPARTVGERVSQTAWQYVTDALSAASWRNEREFAQFKGEVLHKDISIHVDPTGEWYLINDELHKAFTNEAEARGDDIDEELLIRRSEVD